MRTRQVLARRRYSGYLISMAFSAIRSTPPISWLPFIGISERAPVVAVLRLSGVIATGSKFRSGLSLAGLASQIERAFSMRRVSAIALVINSPGGSPAQSALICDRIRALADEKKKPVYAFTEDVAASGGYWLACAADEIYANENSIIGSIGVIYSGFGFQEALEKLGIERRLYTAGDKKAVLDPFTPQKESDVKRLKSLQKDFHKNFKGLVRARRGDRLKGSARTLFSGEFWTGASAVELGLIDGIGDVRSVMREKFGDKVELRLLGRRQGLFSMLRRDDTKLSASFNIPTSLGHDLADGLITAAEERLIWNRYGL